MADKGGKMVSIAKAVYKNKMLDSTTYKRVICKVLEDLQRDSSDHLCRFNNDDYLNIKYHDHALTLSDTMLAKSYGLHKIHKEGFPINRSPLRLISLLTN